MKKIHGIFCIFSTNEKYKSEDDEIFGIELQPNLTSNFLCRSGAD